MFTFSFILSLFYDRLFFCVDSVSSKIWSQKPFDVALVKKVEKKYSYIKKMKISIVNL